MLIHIHDIALFMTHIVCRSPIAAMSCNPPVNCNTLAKQHLLLKTYRVNVAQIRESANLFPITPFPLSLYPSPSLSISLSARRPFASKHMRNMGITQKTYALCTHDFQSPLKFAETSIIFMYKSVGMARASSGRRREGRSTSTQASMYNIVGYRGYMCYCSQSLLRHKPPRRKHAQQDLHT